MDLLDAEHLCWFVARAMRLRIASLHNDDKKHLRALDKFLTGYLLRPAVFLDVNNWRQLRVKPSSSQQVNRIAAAAACLDDLVSYAALSRDASSRMLDEIAGEAVSVMGGGVAEYKKNEFYTELSKIYGVAAGYQRERIGLVRRRKQKATRGPRRRPTKERSAGLPNKPRPRTRYARWLLKTALLLGWCASELHDETGIPVSRLKSIYKGKDPAYDILHLLEPCIKRVGPTLSKIPSGPDLEDFMTMDTALAKNDAFELLY